MAEALAEWFRAEIHAVHRALAEVPAELADTPWRENGWTRKQIVGHLLDSAANNRQRFVRASVDGQYTGPSYAQDAWVAAHGYAERSWPTLLRWWETEHELLMAILDRISPDRLNASCQVGNDAPVTLEFLVRDYVRHQRSHLSQMQASAQS